MNVLAGSFGPLGLIRLGGAVLLGLNVALIAAQIPAIKRLFGRLKRSKAQCMS